MEQRNISFDQTKKDKYLSLDEILNRRYLIKIDNALDLSERKIYIKNFKGKTACRKTNKQFN